MKKNHINYRLVIILSIIIILLIISNIYSYTKYQKNKNDNTTYTSLNQENINNKKDKYNPKEKYYNEINFSEFKSLYKGDNISIIAIVDNSSYTYEKFIELVNKTAYYMDIKINLIEISKLSNKNEIYYYDIDSRFAELESDFFIVVKNEKILSITDTESTELNTLIKTFK